MKPIYAYLLFYSFMVLATLAGAYLKLIPPYIVIGLVTFVAGQATGVLIPSPLVISQNSANLKNDK